MNAADPALALGLGLLSSLHCVQMCGPLVLAYSLPLERTPHLAWRAHLAYNSGRILVYALLGAFAGAAGHAVGLVGRLAGVEAILALVTGALMILAGILMFDLIPKVSLVQIGVTRSFARPLGRLLTAPGALSKFFLGLGLGFLPCGMVYAALLKAMSTGSAASGAATMAAFGLGTAASLVAVGLFSSAIRTWFQGRSPRLAAACVVLLGLLVLWRGFVTPPRHSPSEAPGACHVDHRT